MYDWVDKINWNNVDKVVLVAEAKRQEFLERVPEQIGKVEIIYEAVDPDKFQIKPRKFGGDIGILCHLTPRKRVYELLLTFYELQCERPELHLHIGGGMDMSFQDYYYALHDLVRRLKLEEKVTFYENVKEPWKWYEKVDIFIANAYSEGLQVAPMEAMACGVYCLSHQWAGSDELLPEEQLYYTDSELKQKILHYCDNMDSWQAEQRAVMRSIVCEKFNVHQTKQQVRKVIEMVGTKTLGAKAA
jgi:glycosyltransferase involved in cell wall biosynthesis